ncbi:hypothetical protein Gocc_3100 [Gaiella occulta]|uniref:Uncharacterized protein n=1 Tax=Gaiella occulta TaxID=1002870 RepID=A0A7M2YSM5_9ACTN|nr:hypothetical protein Gocc_3100 [Gaiella occulta]
MWSASRSTDANVSYDCKRTSLSWPSGPATVRTRGRRTGTRRLPNVTLPSSTPCR